MKNSDVHLHRLFKAARAAHPQAQAPNQPPDQATPLEMPEHLKARVLARWRSGSGVDDFGLMLLALFRRALVCGGVAMVLTCAWSYGDLTEEPQNYEDIANYNFRAEEMP